MPWDGYNYEDAFLVSNRLVYEDIYKDRRLVKAARCRKRMSE